jgi:hypothetical protein
MSSSLIRDVLVSYFVLGLIVCGCNLWISSFPFLLLYFSFKLASLHEFMILDLRAIWLDFLWGKGCWGVLGLIQGDPLRRIELDHQIPRIPPFGENPLLQPKIADFVTFLWSFGLDLLGIGSSWQGGAMPKVWEFLVVVCSNFEFEVLKIFLCSSFCSYPLLEISILVLIPLSSWGDFWWRDSPWCSEPTV